ncbi:hypothetical protein ACHAXT_011564, partial [Thalassiosira profunda]
GYAITSRPLLTPDACRRVKERMPKLFRGEFETGVYPDEWHWREGISKPEAAREMCNAWKSDRLIASIVLSEKIGRFVAEVMGWDSVRIAQDDLVWKPPSSSAARVRGDTVGFHQDSAYISAQFEPYENNSVTLWMALDDADEGTGCVEYAAGSHQWRPILHRMKLDERQKDAERGETEGSELASFHSSDETPTPLLGRLADRFFPEPCQHLPWWMDMPPALSPAIDTISTDSGPSIPSNLAAEYNNFRFSDWKKLEEDPTRPSPH